MRHISDCIQEKIWIISYILYVRMTLYDSLSIDSGEVFLLLSQFSSEWGWGRSQKTGKDGLIPIDVMEEIVS